MDNGHKSIENIIYKYNPKLIFIMDNSLREMVVRVIEKSEIQLCMLNETKSQRVGSTNEIIRTGNYFRILTSLIKANIVGKNYGYNMLDRYKEE